MGYSAVSPALVSDFPPLASPIRNLPRRLPLVGERLLRPMRGGSQSQLIEANDGHCYVVKSCNNPQGSRTLATEWIANQVFGRCGIAVATQTPISVDEELLRTLREDREAAQWWPEDAGVLHFGSRLPVHPEEHAIYDVLPEPLLSSVANLDNFVGALVLDTWLGNTDARQAVFFRSRKTLRSMHGNRKVMTGLMIDHGQCLNGATWQLHGFSQPCTPYPWANVYTSITGTETLSPWIDRVRAFTLQELSEITSMIPPEWVQGEHALLEKALHDLVLRQDDLPRLLANLRKYHQNRFPNWH